MRTIALFSLTDESASWIAEEIEPGGATFAEAIDNGVVIATGPCRRLSTTRFQVDLLDYGAD